MCNNGKHLTRIFSVCASPQNSGCILFAPPDASATFLHNDLLCNGSRPVTGRGGGITYLGRGKIGKICKISGENLFFFTAIFMHTFAVKLCHFTAIVRGEVTKGHRISPPLQGPNLSPPACLALFLPLHHLSLTSSIYVLNMNQIHSTFCRTCVVNFSKI